MLNKKKTAYLRKTVKCVLINSLYGGGDIPPSFFKFEIVFS